MIREWRLLSFLKNFFDLCMCMIHICMYNICMPGAHRNQKIVSDALELEL